MKRTLVVYIVCLIALCRSSLLVGQSTLYKVIAKDGFQICIYTKEDARTKRADTLCTYTYQGSKQQLIGVHARYTKAAGKRTYHGLSNHPNDIRNSLFSQEIYHSDSIAPFAPDYYNPTADYGLTQWPDWLHWQWFIYPTSCAEGGYFSALNTYDPAGFTFGFVQSAAHGSRKDSAFVEYFRQVLATAPGKELFPDLSLNRSRDIIETATIRRLVSEDNQNEKLRTYLNPNPYRIDSAEVINAAKFIHIATTDSVNRNIQVKLAILWAKQLMTRYETRWIRRDDSQTQFVPRFSLNGKPYKFCIAIVDVLHQGRSSYQKMSNDIATSYVAKLNNKATFGEQEAINSLLQTLNYPARVTDLKKALRKIEDTKLRCVYDSTTNEWKFEPL